MTVEDPSGAWSDHAVLNADHWDRQAPDWVAAGERAWAQPAATWGAWEIPDGEVELLPASMTGMRAIELGCGTGYVSAWMHRRGASITGVDVSREQLATARRLAEEYGVAGTWHLASAEEVPEPDASFDFAVSEYGAALWCDPYLWVPEAARLLRPGGTLAFLTNHPLLSVCYPDDGAAADRTLHRPWFGLHRLDWSDAPVDPSGVEFNLPIAEWLALFRDHGFDVVDHRELRAPAGASDRYSMTSSWARDFPSEMTWVLAKR